MTDEASDAWSWADLDAAPRHDPNTLTSDVVPRDPGVYAWYRDGERIYVGKADSLYNRVWGNQLSHGRRPTQSVLQRNVAELLGHGNSAAIKSGAVRLTVPQLEEVRTWILGCQVAWLVCPGAFAATKLEDKLKAEYQPQLKR